MAFDPEPNEKITTSAAPPQIKELLDPAKLTSLNRSKYYR